MVQFGITFSQSGKVKPGVPNFLFKNLPQSTAIWSKMNLYLENSRNSAFVVNFESKSLMNKIGFVFIETFNFYTFLFDLLVFWNSEFHYEGRLRQKLWLKINKFLNFVNHSQFKRNFAGINWIFSLNFSSRFLGFLIHMS